MSRSRFSHQSKPWIDLKKISSRLERISKFRLVASTRLSQLCLTLIKQIHPSFSMALRISLPPFTLQLPSGSPQPLKSGINQLKQTTAKPWWVLLTTSGWTIWISKRRISSRHSRLKRRLMLITYLWEPSIINSMLLRTMRDSSRGVSLWRKKLLASTS